MDTLKALEETCLGINLQLQSFHYMQSKSHRLIQVLDKIRSLLNCDECNISQTSSNVFDVTNSRNKVMNDEHVQFQIQRLYSTLTTIRSLSYGADEGEQEENTKRGNENDFDSQCINVIKFIINAIIDSNSILTELKKTKNSHTVLGMKHSSFSNGNGKKSSKSKERDEERESIMTKEQPNTSYEKLNGKPPTEAALETDVILTEIFRRSTTAEVKEFRRVNRKWNENATSVLLSQNSLRIVLDEIRLKSENESCIEYLPIENRSHYIGTLQDLCSLIGSSSKFPCQSLFICRGKPEADDGVKQLLSQHGHYFKEFTLSDKTEVSIHFLVHLLTLYAPNLESLAVYSIPLLFENWKGSIPNLPNLKHIEFKPGFDTYEICENEYFVGLQFFKILLKAAINLQSVETHDFDFLEEIMNTNRLHLIRKLKYSPFTQRGEDDPETNIQIYERIINLKLKLCSLEVEWAGLEDNMKDKNPDDYKVIIISHITSMLESSKEILKQLKIEPLGLYPEIIIPQLPNLNTMSVFVPPDNTDNVAILPPSFSFSKHMPNLSKIILFIETIDRTSIRTYFPENAVNMVCNSVKFLEVQGNIFKGLGNATASGIKGAEMLARMFPNTKSLKIRGTTKIQAYQLNPVLWYFCPNGLKYLEIYGLHNSKCIVGKPVVDSVDPFFTGMSEEACKALRILHENEQILLPEVASFLNQLRSHRSICDLKQLRELNIFCGNFHTDTPFASHVTGMFALGLMPHLKVTVTYNPGRVTSSMKDIDCCLKPIASYVRSVCSHQPQY